MHCHKAMCQCISHLLVAQAKVGLLWTCRNDLGNLESHLTNTCHLQRSSSPEDGIVSEEDAVKLLSELPQVTQLS